jgi:hypothetical protein
MVEKHFVDYEKESYKGLSTLELAQRIIGNNSKIQQVSLRVYEYIPQSHINPEYHFRIPKKPFLEIQQKVLDELAENHGKGWNVALSSRVVLEDGREGHLILVDLALSKSKKNLELVKNRFKEMIKPQYGGGFFLETGNSYHYFGENLLDSRDELVEFSGNSLITSIVADKPTKVSIRYLVDDRHVGHSLIRGSFNLRLTTKGSKKFIPRVVDYI